MLELPTAIPDVESTARPGVGSTDVQCVLIAALVTVASSILALCAGSLDGGSCATRKTPA